MEIESRHNVQRTKYDESWIQPGDRREKTAEDTAGYAQGGIRIGKSAYGKVS